MDPSDLGNRDEEFIGASGAVPERGRALVLPHEADGVEHVPAEGPFMAVGNHTAGRSCRRLGHPRLVGGERRHRPRLIRDGARHRLQDPIVNNLLMKIGALPARPENAERAAPAGAAVLGLSRRELDCLRPSAIATRSTSFDHTGS